MALPFDDGRALLEDDPPVLRIKFYIPEPNRLKDVVGPNEVKIFVSRQEPGELVQHAVFI
jgi:hypothetical protein